MGNCGSFPKTKGDDADIPAPVVPKEESLKDKNDPENVKVEEEEEKTITTDDHVNVKDVEKKDSDDGEAKPADDNNPQSLGSLLTETGEKVNDAESEEKPEVSSESKEEKEPIKVEKEKAEKVQEKTEPEKAYEAPANAITQSDNKP